MTLRDALIAAALVLVLAAGVAVIAEVYTGRQW